MKNKGCPRFKPSIKFACPLIFFWCLQAQTVVRMFIQKANLSKKDLQGKTMRWDSKYAIDCAQLRMKDCSAYRHIKAKGLLPLPSEETLRKIISSSECDFGLNELALHFLLI